jgi:hypothetical protein
MVQLLHFLHQRRKLFRLCVIFRQDAGFANSDVQIDSHGLAREPARAADIGLETDAVLAGVGGREGEFAFCSATLVHDAVVVVEDFLS